MADYSERTETVTRRVWALSLPTNMVEVAKVSNAIYQQLAAENVEIWDDTIEVEADETELRYVFTKVRP